MREKGRGAEGGEERMRGKGRRRGRGGGRL